MSDAVSGVHYRFESDGFDPSLFQVVDFSGFQQISSCYEYTINLASTDMEVDLGTLGNEAAHLIIAHGDEEEKIHGVISECHQTGTGQNVAYYRVVLVPRLWLLSLQVQNQVHQDQKVEATLREELEQSGLVQDEDFAIRLTRTDYPEREYIVQYQESDLAFLCRQMEHWGIFFYFEQGEEKERVIIADANSAFPAIEGDAQIAFRPPAGQTEESEVVHSLVCTQKRMPEKVILADFNYRTPSVQLRTEHVVSPNGRGIVSRYGDHFKTPEEGAMLAEVRAQEILSHEKVFRGDATVIRFHEGRTFTLEEHPRADLSGSSFLLESLRREGTQPLGAEGEESGGTYRSEFVMIPADTAYRPPRNTPKPKLYGVLNAKVDAAGSGQYAEIDSVGRYKVKLPFDLTDRCEGQASRYIRKSEPYAGPGYGQHFPLHRDCEVLLTCVDGDPDRPIIANAVPNAEMASPVNESNQRTSQIRTGGGILMELDDSEGNERIKMTCPKSNTYFHLGSANQDNDGLACESEGQCNMTFHDDWYTVVMSNRTDSTHGSYEQNVFGDLRKVAVSTREEKTVGGGGQDIYVSGDQDVLIGGKRTVQVVGDNKLTASNTERFWKGSSMEVTGAAKLAFQLSFQSTNTAGAEAGVFAGIKVEEMLGGKASFTQAFRMENTVGPNIIESVNQDVKAKGLLKMQAGIRAEISSTPVVVIKGNSAVDLEVGGTYIKISGGKIHMNAPQVQIDADVHITKKLQVDGGINEQ